MISTRAADGVLRVVDVPRLVSAGLELTEPLPVAFRRQSMHASYPERRQSAGWLR